MATAIEAEVRAILTTDREQRINRAYNQAWLDWWTSADRQKISRWPRTRANNLFEYLATRLVAEFKGDDEAKFIWHRESFKLIIDCRLVIRFKKSNGNGVGSNIGTQAEFEFRDPQADLPGLPGIQKVEIVYALNVTETAIAEVTVLARNGDKRRWSYDITGNSGGAAVIPLMQTPPPTADIDQMIVPKKTTGKEEAAGDK